MTAKINSDHAFILWSEQVGLACYMSTCLLLNKICFSIVCITCNFLLGLRGAWENLLLGLERH